MTASASLEASTDIRERGLSMNDGKLGVTLDGSLPLGENFVIDASAETLRGSARNGGSDLGLQIAPAYSLSSDGWNVRAGLRGHVYIDAGELDYIEVEGTLSHTIGPMWLSAGASYAPSQDAIGGSNLYLHANAEIGIPGMPLTVFAGAGQTIGTTSLAARAVRLRPDGNYTDWYLGIERTKLNFAIGLELTGTSIDPDSGRSSIYWDKHSGSRVAGYVRVSF